MIVAVMTTALAGTAWAEVISGTTYSTPSIDKLPSEWTGKGNGNNGYIQLTASDHYIKTSNFAQNGFISIVLKARKYGGPSAEQALITVSWYEGDTETVLGTVSPTNTTLTDYTISSPNNPTGNTTGYVKIQCKGASSSKGSGVSEVTITYNASGGDTPTPTYTVTFDAGDGTFVGSTDFPNASNTKTAGTYTLPSATRDGYTFNGWVTTGSTTPVTGNYTVSGNVDFTAQYTENTTPSGNEQWVLTNLADLTSTDIFVIVGNNGDTYAMKNTGASNSGPVVSSVSVNGTKLSGAVADDIKWNISGNDTDGYIFYPNGSTTTWLYCIDNNNGLRIGSGNTDYNTFVINTSYLYNTGRSRFVGIYNSTDWRSYTSINNNIKNQTFAFYKRVEAGAPQAPSFTITNNDELAYGTTSGSFEFTVNNPVTGGVTSVSENVDWISNAAVSGNTVTFTTTANEANTSREGIITLTYSYGDNQTITENVTVTQAAAPVIYTTIPALFEAATSTETEVNINFGGWVVSGVNSSTAYLTDNQGNGLIIYASEHGFQVGDVLTGTVSCKLQLFRGSAELTNLTSSTEGLSVAHNGTVTEASIEMANLAGVNTGVLVSYENLTCSVTTSGSNTNYDLTDGTTTIRVYKTLYDFTSTPDLEDGKTYNITGVYQQYNSTKEILPRSAADIEEVVSTTPSIVVDPDEVSEDAEEHEGTLDVTYENLTITDMSDFDIQFYDADNNELNGDDAPDWIEILVAEAEGGTSYVVSYYMLDNDGAARTAYFKVFAMGTEDFVYSNLVTVTQAAFVAPPTPITTNGNYFVKVTSTADITDGAYLIVYEDGGVAFDGSLETLDAASNTIEVTIKNGVIAANSTNKAAAFFVRPSNNTLMTQSGKYVGRTANSNGLNVDDSELTNTFSIDDDGNAVITASGNCTMKYNSASDQLRFRYYKSGQKAIQLYKLVDEAAGLNSEGYATFASTSALDFSGATDYTAWAITGVSGTDITFSQITGAVPAGTGVLLKGTASTPVVLTTTTGATTAVTGNKLVGITTATAVTAGQYYGLSGKTFVKVNAGNVPAGRALLPAEYVTGTGDGVKTLTFNFDEDATAIKAIDNCELTTDGVIYNVAGQRLSKMQKGINIVNGRKVLY